MNFLRRNPNFITVGGLRHRHRANRTGGLRHRAKHSKAEQVLLRYAGSGWAGPEMLYFWCLNGPQGHRTEQLDRDCTSE